MSFGMGVMDNNKVHTTESSSSKVSSFSSNGNDSEEKLGGNVNVLQNTASTRLLKFKRRKVFAVRDFPPGCGSIAMRLRSSTKNENVVQSCEEEEEEKLKLRDDEQKQKCNDFDVVVVVAAQVESNKVEPVKEASDEVMIAAAEKAVDVQPLSTMPKDDDGVNMQEAMIEESDELVFSPEKISYLPTMEPVKAQPLRICLPDDDGGSIAERDMVVFEDEQSPGRDHIDTEDEAPKPIHVSGKRKAKKGFPIHAPLKKGLPDDDGGRIAERDMVVFEDEQSPGRDHIVDTEDEAPKRIHVSGKRKAKKGFPIHAPLKVNKTMSREYGEGSKRKLSSPDREDSPERKQRKTLEVGLPPSRPGGSSGGGGGGDSNRNKVKESLRLFYGTCRKLTQEEEAKPKLEKKKNFRVDFEASKILKSKGIFAKSATQVMGTVPGVEVGDEFQYRMELNLLGIHKQSQGGIDSMKVGDVNLATSIVCSGGYDDDLDNNDVLTYTGQGGNVMKKGSKKGEEKKEPEDQKLITGNLALANSVKAKNPVRVIKGHKKAVLESSGDNKRRNYVYDGLYIVEEFWQETGSHGKLVFKFKLRRIPGQPELSWRVVKKSNKTQIRLGLCRLDISEGRERLPISAINEIDDEKPPSFMYTAEMIYPDWCRPVPPKGCGCNKRCTETNKCVCVGRNGGEIPYNYDGAIVSAKNLIYECGPLCKCPPSCYLRVTQRGIKFQLEIFKTESRGWGVRSLSSISSGSFICEYVGELLEDKEAERRTGNDEYLFDIGNKYDNPLAEGMSKLMPETKTGKVIEEEDGDEMSGGFTIDAARKGNVGRFINHSCSPNLYAQNVLYDHEDARIPHVMFFAMDNIPPLQELTYHYNYMIDQVRDSKGNIKKKICYCGSSECTGRLY